MDTEGYTIERHGQSAAVVRFPEFGNVRLTAAHDAELTELASAVELIVVDLSGTAALSTTWWRLIGRLATRAKRLGGRLAVVGASDVLSCTADAVGVLDLVESAATVADVLP